MKKYKTVEGGYLARLVCEDVKGDYPLLWLVDDGNDGVFESIVRTTKDFKVFIGEQIPYIVGVKPTLAEWLQGKGDNFVPDWSNSEQTKVSILYDYSSRKFTSQSNHMIVRLFTAYYSLNVGKKLLEALNSGEIDIEGLI